ncbi:MAG: hypothetical protein B5M51_08045 [Anaerolinea sp. 4484_236]|nr:MAG: hypothetical protein B5M51_08045 [Anaerolinea sp. 4484_236]
MVAVYEFLSIYEGLIYFVLIIGGVFMTRWLWRTWRAWREAIFGLEKEMAQRRLARAVAAMTLFLVFFFGEFIVASFIVPSLPPSYFLSTPTLDLLRTPTGTISAELAATMAALPTISADAVSEGCIPDEIFVASPVPGENISGLVTIEGVVDVPNLGFYKLEISSRGTENWQTFYASRGADAEPDDQQNEEGADNELGRLDTGELIPGDYLLRLVVTDNQGQSLPACVVQIQIIGQEE